MSLVDASFLGLTAAVESFELCCLDVPVNALRSHRLPRDTYLLLVRQQGGGCAICGEAAWRHPIGPVPLLIDHDHVCCAGRRSCGHCVRGLLCSGCNGSLGLLELHGDADFYPPAWIDSAKAYLERSGIDPWAPDRFAASGRVHRDRRAAERIVCSCYHCTGDLQGRSGWVAAAITAGESVWDEVTRRTEATRDRDLAAGWGSVEFPLLR